MILCILIRTVKSCPSSVPTSAGITTEQANFTWSSNILIRGVAAGKVSNSLYYLYDLSSTSQVVVRKEDTSGSQLWMASFAFRPVIKSLSIDALEQTVYFAQRIAPVVVMRLSSSTGAVVSQESYASIDGQSDDIKIWPLADSSGYYFIGYDSSSPYNAKIFKYTFSTLSAQFQLITNIQKGWGHLMLSPTQIFVLGASSSSPYALHMYKVTFLSTSVDWANQMACGTVTCVGGRSESFISSDGLSIYSFFLYGSSTYMYFTTLSISTGSATGTRYRSSVSVGYVWGSAINEDYIIVTTLSPLSLLIYSISTSVFTIKTFSGNELDGCTVEPTSGRFIVGGELANIGYIAKFTTQSIGTNTYFTAASWSMITLTAIQYSISFETGVTLGSGSSFTITSGSYTNQSATYTPGTTTTSDIYYQVLTESISVVEDNSASTTPDLSCSFSGTTSISYSISNYGSSTAPSWVSINPNTGVLSITAPSVSTDTEFDFYVTSIISGVSNLVQKLIKLTIYKCQVQNCQICSSSSSSVCATCNSGYTQTSGACIIQVSTPKVAQNSNSTTAQSSNSTTAQALRTMVMCIILSIFCMSFLQNLTTSTSVASFWSMIHNIQMLFLILLIQSYIPQDVKTVIKGLKFTINIYSYIPLNKIKFITTIFSIFEFPLTFSSLTDFNINSDCSIINIYPMVICVICLIPIHLCLYFINKIFKANEEGCCKYPVIFIKQLLCKLYNFLTFGFYIRNFIEMSQLILIFSTYEIYKFNIESTLHLLSTLVAIFLLLLYISFILFTLYLVLSSYKINKDSHNKLGEFFLGIKQQKPAQFYLVVLLVRKCIYIMLLICLVSTSSKILIVFVLYAIYLRPFEESKTNMIEIINETYFICLILPLIFLNSESDWTPTITSIYMWVLSSNSMVVVSIIFIDGVRTFVKWIVRRCSSDKVAPKPASTLKPNPEVNIQNKESHIKTSKMAFTRQNIEYQGKNRKLDLSQINEESKISCYNDNSQISIQKMNQKKDWS